MLEELKEQVCAANKELERLKLAIFTFGNVSGIDRSRGLIVIKPSGVAYADLQPADLVVLDLHGKVIEGSLRPSSDTPTHLALYRSFTAIAGVTHTHSPYATMFAQAGRGIPCLGTTHADYFHGEIPCTRPLARREVESEYEASTGQVIVQRFSGDDPMHMPAVLVAGHGPFAWGRSAMDSVHNAAYLEAIAQIAIGTIQLAPRVEPIPGYLLDKHFLRKHGGGAYYGQGGR